MRDADDFQREQTRRLKLGATGDYPLGKLSRDDQGELRAAIGAKDGHVVINFGKEVSWLSITPTGARALATLLNEKADALDPLPARKR